MGVQVGFGLPGVSPQQCQQEGPWSEVLLCCKGRRDPPRAGMGSPRELLAAARVGNALPRAAPG